jgi:outer membrane protein
MNIKKFALILFINAVLLSCNSQAFAEGVACIDLNKIINNYSKAQELSADLKIKSDELKKMSLEAKKNIDLAKISDKKQLESKYGKEFKVKQELYKQQYLDKLKQVEINVQEAVKTVAKNKNVATIFNKNSIIMGGEDLTDDVISVLKNKAN